MQIYQNVTYGDPVAGPAFWVGYNPYLLSAEAASSSHGARYLRFADAGDTNNGAGGHGIEFNAGFRSKDGSHATNAIEIVAVDDNANVVSPAFRCGTGQDAGGWSEINFSNSDASLDFMTMDGVTGDITAYQPRRSRPSSSAALRDRPAGIPTFQAGSVACAYDTKDNRLYVYNSGWQSVVLQGG